MGHESVTSSRAGRASHDRELLRSLRFAGRDIRFTRRADGRDKKTAGGTRGGPGFERSPGSVAGISIEATHRRAEEDACVDARGVGGLHQLNAVGLGHQSSPQLGSVCPREIAAPTDPHVGRNISFMITRSPIPCSVGGANGCLRRTHTLSLSRVSRRCHCARRFRLWRSARRPALARRQGSPRRRRAARR